MFEKIKILVVSVVIAMIGAQGLVMAQGTILPMAPSDESCDQGLNDFGNQLDQAAFMRGLIGDQKSALLGCAIITGRASLAMVPYFIQYFSNYLMGIISIVALLFTVLGGIFYISSGLDSAHKDRGKTYITNALIGMSIAFVAWTVVNVIISAITG